MTDPRSNNEFDSLESFFHERLKDASLPREEGPWKKIEAELERMEKEKRRRGFFWFFFGGIALLGGLAALWFFVIADKFNVQNDASKKTIAVISKKQEVPPTSAKEMNSISTENSSLENNVPSKNSQTNASNEKNNFVIAAPPINTPYSSEKNANKSSAMIQLAACRNKANPAIFKNLPFAVIEAKGKDGYTRYFAETPVNNEALETVRSSGFAGAFVKKDLDAASESVTVKEAGTSENNVATSFVPPATSTKKQSVADHQQLSLQKQFNNEITPVTKESKQSTSTQTVAATEISPTDKNDTPKESQTNSIAQNASVKTENPPPATSNENPNAGNTTSIASDTSNRSQVAEPTKTDSVEVLAEAETKKDSLPQKQETKDSSKTVTAQVEPAPFSPEWALVLLAGPNIFTSQAQSNLYPTSGESQPITLNTELKLQYRPFKLFSFSGGVNYTTFSTKQDKTSFRFNKHQTSDYIFYSAFGPMAAPMSTLLDGYSPLAPMDTFPCSYSQSSKLNMLNIPLEANLHLLNRSRINIFVGLGANSSFVLSQQSTLTLHKEHFDNNISYNKVTVAPFSLALMFSLGCDVRVGKKLYLSFVPSYRYGVTDLSGTSGTTFSPAYFSGNAGLKFKF